jgi:hypothetical protein
MEDVGSTFLGALFAGAVLLEPRIDQVLGLLLSGPPIFQVHRLHLFQRLHQAGWPHARVAKLYGLATLLSGMALLGFGPAGALAAAIAELTLGLWLNARVAVPFRAAVEGSR